MARIHTFVDAGLGHSSYLVDLGDGTAAVVDPPRFPAPHQAAARASGLALRWTIDTHSHADYVTGSPALAAHDGVTFIAPGASRLQSPHQPIHDEERVELAPGASLTALATPGHTPDHHVYLLEQGGAPKAVFSGGSLMVGAVGRTDLCGPELAEPLAHDMFHSLRRLDYLPDDVAVYPTHGAGSFCSAPGGAERTSTLGRERATNPLFAIRDEDTFVQKLLDGLGSFPAHFALLPELNRIGPRLYEHPPILQLINVSRVEAAVASGALIVDVRPAAAFAGGHAVGSMSNALRPAFANWLGWLIELDRPIVIVAEDGQDRDDIVRQCLDIGHEAILGELDGGIWAWHAAGGRITGIPFVGSDDMVGTIVDVRQHSEFESGHVPGAINIELGSLATSEIPSGPITVMCGHGERAMTGASLLTGRGHRDVSVLNGGAGTWAAETGRSLTEGK